MSKTGQCGGRTDVAESLYVTQQGVRRIKVDEGHVLWKKDQPELTPQRFSYAAPAPTLIRQGFLRLYVCLRQVSQDKIRVATVSDGQ